MGAIAGLLRRERAIAGSGMGYTRTQGLPLPLRARASARAREDLAAAQEAVFQPFNYLFSYLAYGRCSNPALASLNKAYLITL
jgi:hypothetical protein